MMDNTDSLKEDPKYVNLGIVQLSVVQYLEKIGLNLSHLFVLLSVGYENKLDVPAVLLATLERKNYLLNGNLTNEGSLIVDKYFHPEKIDVETAKKELKAVKSELNSQFLIWWEHYPVGNTWKDDEAHGSKLYKGTRGFRTQKDNCEKLYLKALADGYTPQQMLDAIDYEVDEKKKESRRTGQNKLDYMINTHTYLLNRLFVNFIEMMKIEGYKPEVKGKRPESTGFQTMLI